MPSPTAGFGLPSFNSIASAGLSFMGDLFGGDDADAIAWQNHLNREAALDAQRAAVTAGQESRDLTQRLHASNLEFQGLWAGRSLDAQREAAQNAVQWRMADAEKAGIHPMYALGMQPVNVSPVSVFGGGVGAPPPSETVLGHGAMAPTLRDNMGQNITRSLMKMLNKEERAAAADEKIYRRQQMRSNELDIMMKEAELAKLQKDQLGPPAPSAKTLSDGSSFRSGATLPIPIDKSSRGMTVDRQASMTYTENADGSIVPRASKDVGESLENEGLPAQIGHFVTNRLIPTITNKPPGPPPKSPAPGVWYTWHFGAWQPTDKYGMLNDVNRKTYVKRGYFRR